MNIKTSFAWLLLIVATATYAKDKRYCTAPPDPGIKLTNVEVYSGLPKDLALRSPDSGPYYTSIYDLTWDQAQPAGVYLVCGFDKNKVTEKVDQDATKCTVKSFKNRSKRIVTCGK